MISWESKAQVDVLRHVYDAESAGPEARASSAAWRVAWRRGKRVCVNVGNVGLVSAKYGSVNPLIGGLDLRFGDLNPWFLQRVNGKPPRNLQPTIQTTDLIRQVEGIRIET